MSSPESTTPLLGSQKAFMWAKEQERMYMGGWRLGKTWCLCKAGFLLSYNIPDNFGFIGRASGKDLHTTTVKTFFDEVCPANYIVGKPKKVGQSGLIVTIKCDPSKYPGQTSQIYFDYIIDKITGRSHLAGGNWGWFGVDQVEEIQRVDWVKLKGRLSRTMANPNGGRRIPIKTHAMGVGNQMGHDWIFEDFFESGDYTFDLKNEPGVFFKQVRTSLGKLVGETHLTSRLGIIGRAEENAMSNGGYVPDEYYADQRRSNPPEFVARYMDGSFDDFTGKIYADYNLGSVHNIDPFEIPAHWPWGCCIDPGGSVPWGVGVWRMDEEGNKVLVDDAQQLYAARINPNHVVNWIKKHTPVDNCRYIVDYQNVPVMVILQEAGIYCESAMKDIKVGLNGAINEMFVNPAIPLPKWYESTQPRVRWEKYKDNGSPRVFVFNTCKAWMKEHDNYIWDPVKKNVPKGDQRDDHCDETRYFLASKPSSALPLMLDPYRAFRKYDPVSAGHCDTVAKELERHRREQNRDVLDLDPYGGIGDGKVEIIGDFM